MAPRLPSTHWTLPPVLMLTPLACSPSCSGELVKGASQPTVSLLIWQRVTPDLGSMKTSQFGSGGSGMAPAGVVGLAGAVGLIGRRGAGLAVADGGVGVTRGVGKD